MYYDIPSHISGDTWTGIETITLKENGDAVDLTNCNIYIQFRFNYNVASPVMYECSTEDETIVISDATCGILSIPEQMINIPVGKYSYDLVVNNTVNNTFKTYLNGTWEILSRTTR
jgi:hypothetical protein